MNRGTLSALVQDARFEVVRELGHGADATVYLVWDNADEAFRAVKILGDDHRERFSVLRRFVREARLLSRLEHPHVVRLYRTGLIDGRPYLVTEYADGGSTAEWVRRHGPMPAVTAAEMISQASDAVDAAHRAGVIHRDLKPSNLLLSSRGVLVGDFGIARTLDTGFTSTGESLGTLAYVAPEQLDDARSVDFAADVYSLGATLYALVTGRVPHDLYLARRGSPVLEPLPEPLRPIVTKACDRRRERRHTSAAALAQDLDDAMPALRRCVQHAPMFADDEPTLQRQAPDASRFRSTVVPSPPEDTATPLQTLRRLWSGWVTG